MIQELLGGGAGLIGERKIPLTGVLEASPSPTPSPSSSTTTTPTSSSENQNLRCPRCDSPNTKFCYYNNYNLTQPRHFCKTCRRYWTKGGALRNVPIGGGCRKNKSVGVIPSLGKPTTGNLKSTVPSEIGKPGFISGFDHELPSNPTIWPSPQSTHLLALLRSAQNPNPNPMLNSVSVKEEGFLFGSHMNSSEPGPASTALNARALGLDSLGQVPSIGLCSSFWRSNQNQAQQHQQNGFILGEVQNTTGIPDLYQRLSSSSADYSSHHSPVLLGNVASSSSAAILESAPVSGGELGYWNPSLSWSDLPTTNGAYP